MKKTLAAALLAVSAGAAMMNAHPVKACTTLVIGKDATSDGSTIIARNEDLQTSWAKHFVVHQATNNGPTKYTSKGTGFTIDLPAQQQRWTATPDWDPSNGDFSEDGVNSSNVAMSATETASSNKKVLKYDPWVKNGISEDSMVNVVLPFIKSPREGVQRLGDIINKYGANEGAAGGIIFSDKNDIWYMEVGSGHQWVAERVPSNKYAVIPNQLVIGDIDFNDSNNFMCSPTLKQFIKDHHLNKGHKDVNWARIFGTSVDSKENKQYNTPRMWGGQRILTPSDKQSPTDTNFKLFMKPDHKVTMAQVREVMATYYQGTKYSERGKYVGKYRPIGCAIDEESHIIQMRQNMPDSITPVQWLCMATPVTGVYVPFYTDINNTPASYQKGTDKFTPDSAYWTYEMTWDLTNANYKKFFKKDVVPVQSKVQKQLDDNLKQSDSQAKSMNGDQATDFLTKQNQNNADYALNKYNDLNSKLLNALGTNTPFMNAAKASDVQ